MSKLSPESADKIAQWSPSMHGAVRAILFGGLVAGTLDIGAACAINWLSPLVILHAIASGLLGKPSFQMGATSAVLGLLLQWFMSCLIAAVYVGATYLQPALLRRWAWSGCAYGFPIFFVMNYVVLPMSAVGHRASFTPPKAAGNLIAMIWFGFVVAYFARDWAMRSMVTARSAAIANPE
jgi:hypothetical protein